MYEMDFLKVIFDGYAIIKQDLYKKSNKIFLD
jgi:hypothetical protein